MKFFLDTREAYILRIRIWAVLILVCILVLFAIPSDAHEWYPQECCDDRDCRPYSSEDVGITQQGYKLKDGTLIPHGDARIRSTPPDGEGYHLCTTCDEMGTCYHVCLFVPNVGV